MGHFCRAEVGQFWRALKLIEAKQLAAERHLPLTRLFEDSLRLYLGEQSLRRAQAEPAPLPLLRDPVPVEGIDLDDTSRLWEFK